MNYPPSQWERIMKIQDVFEKAHHKHLTWREAAEILHVDERTIRRWKQTVEENGYKGLLDRRTQRPSPRRASEIVRNQVLKLYYDIYRDWNVKHFYEQLAKYGVSYKIYLGQESAPGYWLYRSQAQKIKTPNTPGKETSYRHDAPYRWLRACLDSGHESPKTISHSHTG